MRPGLLMQLVSWGNTSNVGRRELQSRLANTVMRLLSYILARYSLRVTQLGGERRRKKSVVFSDGFIQSGHIRQSFHQMVHVHHAYGKQRELNLERDSVFLSKVSLYLFSFLTTYFIKTL